MQQTESTTGIPTVVHAGEGRAISAFGNDILFKLVRAQTAGPMTLGLAMIPPGGGPPPHHERGDELFIIIEGRYQFLLDGDSEEVGPGAVVFVPHGAVHTFKNIGDTVSRHWVINLSGDFDEFFGRAAQIFAAGGPPDRAGLLALAREYGAEFV